MSEVIYGLIGNPVKHSLSPAMHMAAFKALNIDADYRLFELRPEELEAALLGKAQLTDIDGQKFSSSDISGFNITIPYKVRAREILEKNFSLDNDAKWVSLYSYYVRISGAVNTLKREPGGLKYYNTDAEGFLESVKSDLKFKTEGKSILVIGCGGAGRAVIAALSYKDAGIKKIYIADIKREAMDSAARHFEEVSKSANLNFMDRLKFISIEDAAEIIKRCDLLVNASVVGMKDEDGSVIDKRLLHKNLYVYDVVYNRNRETALIKDTKSLGRPAVDGLSMLLYQGAIAFNLWTGRPAPVKIMREALDREINPVTKG